VTRHNTSLLSFMNVGELPQPTEALEPTPAPTKSAKRFSAVPRWLGKALGRTSSKTSTGEDQPAHSPETAMWNDGDIVESTRLRFIDVGSLSPDRYLDESEAPDHDEELDSRTGSHAELARLLDTISELLSSLPERGERRAATPVARTGTEHAGIEPDPIGEVQAALKQFRLKLLDIYGDDETAGDRRFSSRS
jgi:hypothetical protein